MLISNEILFFYVISILYFYHLEAWTKLIYGNRQNKIIRNLNKRGAVHVVNMARFGNINTDEVTYLFSSFSDILWYRNQT
jgi:hypothetical protein